MRLGATTFVTDQSITPVALARALEERGFDSMWVAEHTHIPVSRRTPYRNGEELPEMYRRSFDPLVALTAAGAVTERLGLGTAVCLVAQHDPIVLAKQIACLDVISRGRFTLGAGFGWNREEMEAHGVDPADRWTLVRENVGAMRAMWTEDEASYDGTLVRLEPSWCWPKPSQPNGPRVFLGGAGGPRMVEHVVEYADGWLSNQAGSVVDVTMDELRRRAEAAGRDPSSIGLIVPGPGDPAFIDAQVRRGCELALLAVPSAPADVVLRFLDRHAALAAELNSDES